MQQDALAHDWPSACLYAFTPNCPASSGHQTGQGSQMFSPPGGPTLEEPDIVPRFNAAVSSSPVANTGPILSQAKGMIWHPRLELWSLHVWIMNGSLCSFQREITTQF